MKATAVRTETVYKLELSEKELAYLMAGIGNLIDQGTGYGGLYNELAVLSGDEDEPIDDKHFDLINGNFIRNRRV